MQIYGICSIRADELWDTICYVGCDGNPFKRADVLRRLKWHKKTAELYFDRFYHWTLAHPEEFSGPASKLTRVGHGVYRMEDNPDR